MDKLKNNIGVIMVILGLIGSTGTFYSKFATMELKIEQLSNATAPDLTGIETNGFAVLDLDKNISILEKEIELLKVQLQELKINSSNPLSQ
jgi:hypothetical protein|uniref:Uncharacterized protein n=1 Tax=uncultured marine virus TaxID=186617 RepID=A0A0F7L8I8_9VIRU|nr:hypothetical protein [uncultured marine virus]